MEEQTARKGKAEQSNGQFVAPYRMLLREYVLSWREAKTVPYMQLFKYADRYDHILMCVGLFGAVINGLSLPVMLAIQSHLLNSFGSLQNDPILLSKKVAQDSLYFVCAALVSWLACCLEVTCWMLTGQRQASRIRIKYLRAILRQNVGYFDCEISTSEINNSISADTQLLQEAMSEKVGNFIKNTSQFLGGYIVAFVQLWKMALVTLPFIPLLVLPGVLYSMVISDFVFRMQLAYGRANNISEQAISSVRVVYSYVAEKATVKAYSESLEMIVELGKKQGIAKGLAMGSNGITFALWALLGWYGGTLVMHGQANGAQVLTSGFAILTGGLALGNAMPHIKLFFEACIAAFKIFEVIDRVPPIDLYNMTGKKLRNVEGRIEFKNVNFAYPSRLGILVLRNFSLDVLPGKTVALVGSSGSGKSTVISLIERFYDPLSGEICLDGTIIRDLQLKWLRDQIGLVSQEPALFEASVKENILYGKDNASIDEVVEAANMADAHGFIMSFPNGYGTQVGERGVQMSGGQKQRIAIARALLKKPRILLLDEATSALDTEAEKLVQEALDKASVGRTTLVVAHRLSTIHNADLIVVIENGIVTELGTHKQLMEKTESGFYAAQILLQQSQQEVVEAIDVSEAKEKPSTELSSTTKIVLEPSSNEENGSSSEYVTPIHKMNDQSRPSFLRLLALNRPEWTHCMLGALGAIGFGIVQPLYAYLVGTMVSSYYTQDFEKLKESLKIFSSLFLCLTIASFLVNHVQHYNFSVMGEYLTKRIREKMLSKILTFEVAWFDDIENSAGAVCSRLACDANKVRSLFGDRISLLVQTASAVAVSIIIGLMKAWRLALVMTAIQPLIIYCYYYRKKSLTRVMHKEAKAQQETTQVATEAVSLQRTVTAFCAQEKIISRFQAKLQKTKRQTLRHSFYSGVTIGAAQFILFSSWALDFWYAGRLVKNGQATFRQVFQTFFVLVSTGRVLAEAGTLTPDFAKGSTAVEFVFKILDRNTKIESDNLESWKPEKIEGLIELRNVTFAYPSRPDEVILRNFNLKVHAGSTFAIVGQSGSGKSTIIGLIQRFYDPLGGKVMIDRKDIKLMHLQTIRQHIGLVSQEPALFAASIRENIAYGRPSTSEEEINEAARAANAHNFICALPNGYSTFAGERGLQLSGGQKQRIALARAILKNPEILLLDEATSALDAESEGLVQASLEKMRVGRTTIVIAHRLSTIRNAERIAVMQGGALIEEGSHEELLARGEGGAYFSFVYLQGAA